MLAVSRIVIYNHNCHMLQKRAEDKQYLVNFQGYVLTFQYLL